jgi:hypothetical protein
MEGKLPAAEAMAFCWTLMAPTPGSTCPGQVLLENGATTLDLWSGSFYGVAT